MHINLYLLYIVIISSFMVILLTQGATATDCDPNSPHCQTQQQQHDNGMPSDNQQNVNDGLDPLASVQRFPYDDSIDFEPLMSFEEHKILSSHYDEGSTDELNSQLHKTEAPADEEQEDLAEGEAEENRQIPEAIPSHETTTQKTPEEKPPSQEPESSFILGMSKDITGEEAKSPLGESFQEAEVTSDSSESQKPTTQEESQEASLEQKFDATSQEGQPETSNQSQDKVEEIQEELENSPVNIAPDAFPSASDHKNLHTDSESTHETLTADDVQLSRDSLAVSTQEPSHVQSPTVPVQESSSTDPTISREAPVTEQVTQAAVQSEHPLLDQTPPSDQSQPSDQRPPQQTSRRASRVQHRRKRIDTEEKKVELKMEPTTKISTSPVEHFDEFEDQAVGQSDAGMLNFEFPLNQERMIYTVFCIILVGLAPLLFSMFKSKPAATKVSETPNVQEIDKKMNGLARKEAELIDLRETLEREARLAPLRKELEALKSLDLDKNIKSQEQLLKQLQRCASLTKEKDSLENGVRMVKYNYIKLIKNLVELDDLPDLLGQFEWNKQIQAVNDEILKKEVGIELYVERMESFKRSGAQWETRYSAVSDEIRREFDKGEKLESDLARVIRQRE